MQNGLEPKEIVKTLNTAFVGTDLFEGRRGTA